MSKSGTSSLPLPDFSLSKSLKANCGSRGPDFSRQGVELAPTWLHGDARDVVQDCRDPSLRLQPGFRKSLR